VKKLQITLTILFIISFYSCSVKDKSSPDSGVKVLAYYYPHGSFDPGKLPLNKLTHIIYSFTEVIGNEMKFKDDSSGIKLKMLVAQRIKHPHLKIMIACGGWGGSGGFSEMARSAENRKKFIESAVRFIRRYGSGRNNVLAAGK
jgi:chitinase